MAANPAAISISRSKNLAGSGFNDHLTGNGAANVLTGQGGADTISGGGGDDTLLGDFAGDAPPRPGIGTGYTTLGPEATNNSIATAFAISNNFSLAADPDIFDSTTILHTTVNATGNGQGGYYSVNLAAGTVITIDIDGIADPNVHDSFVRLLDSNGNIVAQNDDAGDDPGSTSFRDSSTVFVVQETGTYYILEGSWTETAPGDGWTEAVPQGSTYKVNVSVEFPPAPAQPGVAGADTLSGGGGNDLLDGGLGADTLTGGAGEDFSASRQRLGTATSTGSRTSRSPTIRSCWTTSSLRAWVATALSPWARFTGVQPVLLMMPTTASSTIPIAAPCPMTPMEPDKTQPFSLRGWAQI